MVLLWCRVVCALVLVRMTLADSLPAFPLQFKVMVETTAHLIAEGTEYPPRIGKKLVYYDFPNKRARAAILEGLETGKNYTRRCDLRQEYRVRQGWDRCDRSYMSHDAMPEPLWPSDPTTQLDDAIIDGRRVEQYEIQESDESRSIVSFFADSKLPRRLVNEWKNKETGYYPLMTYDLVDLEAVAPAESAFALDPPWNHTACTRWTGGWPSLHLFHHYWRF